MTDDRFGIHVKKKLGRPFGRTKPAATTVRMYCDTLAQIDGWIAEQPEPRVSRAEAMSVIVTDWMTARGRS